MQPSMGVLATDRHKQENNGKYVASQTPNHYISCPIFFRFVLYPISPYFILFFMEKKKHTIHSQLIMGHEDLRSHVKNNLSRCERKHHDVRVASIIYQLYKSKYIIMLVNQLFTKRRYPSEDQLLITLHQWLLL